MSQRTLESVARTRAPNDELGFFLMWLRRPRRVGAVLPSGRALARAMAGCIDPDAPGVVVELGGGTGSITKAILNAGVAPQDLIVLEREAKLCRLLMQRYPGVRVHCDDARELDRLIARNGGERVKAVVSGLPLLSMERRDCRRLLRAAFSVLADDGEFLQFTYGPASPVTPRQCDALGIVGKREEWILSNLPPAAVWRYRRSEKADSAGQRAA
jgi:phosphatidylethanolamine/phosphatidyl-N-methylethanolamine N-methyltransferase